jgi:hypothetical protein
MEFTTTTAQATNGATMEVATLHHDAHEFIAHGAIIDLSGDYVGCYVRENVPDGHGPGFGTRNRHYAYSGDLIDFQGNVIGRWRETSRWDRWGNYDRYTMRSIRARVNGDNREWIGRYECDWNQFVNLRPSKRKAA